VGKLQTGRFERLGARTYSIKGPGALVDLDETVLGVLQLERQAGMEAHLMQEWETFSTRLDVAAAAGQYSYVMLANPVGSGRLVVVDGWQRSNATNMLIMLTRGIAPGFALNPAAEGLDTRMSTAREPAAEVRALTTNIASFGSIIGDQSDAGWTRFALVLAPDGTLIWRSGVQNEGLIVSMRWAERDAAPFELQ
jgi:hypothetical protein